MNRPLRVLQIVPYPVLPAVAGGKIRIVQLARALSRLGVEITMVAPYHFTQRRSLAAREPFVLRQVPYAPFALPFLLVDRPFPYGMLISYHPGYRALLPVSHASFDLCQIDHPAFVDLAPDASLGIPVVYGSQNVEFDYISAECRAGMVRRIAGQRVRRLEGQLVERAARILACTDADGDRFRELYSVPPDRLTVLPNGVDLAAVDAARAASRGRYRPPRLARRALFSGSDISHNRAAVREIVTRIAPRLERDVEFVILGPCARRASAGINVVLDPHGDVPTYAGPGVVGLNAVETGSGSNLKVLHYLACDLPVLSTPFGLRGFEDLAPWVRTARLDQFPEALRGELPHPSGLRERLERYEWSAIAERAVEAYGELVRPGRALVPA
jgi:hypothetical protein